MLSDNERLARSTIVSTSFYIDFQHFRLLFISSQQRNFSPYSISFNDLYCHRSMLLFSYLVVSVCAILFISSVTSKWIEYFLLIRGTAFINTHRRRHHLHWYVRRDSLYEEALCSLIGLILIRFDASTTYRHFYLLRIVFFFSISLILVRRSLRLKFGIPIPRHGCHGSIDDCSEFPSR